MKLIITSILLFSISWSQTTIEGYVFNSNTNEPVVSANIIVLGASDGASTNGSGFFQFKTDQVLPLELIISHIAYNSKSIVVSRIIPLRIYLEPAVLPGEEISVTGQYSRAEQDVSSSVEILSIEDMEQIGASDVSDALRTISSANIVQEGGGKQTISIRGSNPDEVSVYLDGIRLNDAYTNTANIAAIDQNDLSSIEVIKGGNTTLFSNGNFGGIVFLNTQLPDSSEIKFARGLGLQDEKNQDLSFGAAGRFGPIAIGGRYSGKARRYHGRTTYTTIFNNLAFSGFPQNGVIDIKAYLLEDYLTLPTEAVVQSAQTQLGMMRYRGNLLKSDNWELFASAKLWNWDDDFFTNLSRNIDDKIITAKIGKGINSTKFKSMMNFEHSDQRYIAKNERTTTDSFSTINDNYESIEHGELSRTSQSISGVLQLKSSIKSSTAQQLLWELGLRAENVKTEHLQSIEFESDFLGTLPESSQTDTSFNALLTGFKAGVSASGKSNNVQYKVYFNQGRSTRLPTLNDIYLSNNRSVDFVLDQEMLSSTEVGIEIGNTHLIPQSMGGSYNFTGNYFYNQYSNKIAYQFFSNAPPLPYNVGLANITGFEVSLYTSSLNDLLRLNLSYQKINVDNPVIFPNKPSSRFTLHAELVYKFLSLGYDYYREGEQFIIYNGFVGNNLKRRENTNVSIILKHKIWKANLSLQYVIHNLYSDEPVIANPEVNYLSPFNFFDVHRQLLTVKIEI